MFRRYFFTNDVIEYSNLLHADKHVMFAYLRVESHDEYIVSLSHRYRSSDIDPSLVFMLLLFTSAVVK